MPQIADIKGIGPASAKAIAAGGFDTVEKIATATPAELATVPGIREARAAALIEAANALLGAPAAESASVKAPAKKGTSESAPKQKKGKKEKPPKKDKKSKKKKKKKK
jgi:DNA repair protein RadA